jgi:N-acetylglucosaminyl-diphospho-decaprenol L-rhamnosyltransferase
MSQLAVAIVNYNTREELRACLRTIASEFPREVVVVDNASTDGSIEMLRAEHPEVTLVANRTNPGFGSAANQGVRRCHSRYVLLLNSDTLLQPGVLRALASYLDEHPRAAIVGPRLVYPDGRLQVSCRAFPTPRTLLATELRLDFALRAAPALRHRCLATWLHDRSRVVPWVVGAAMAIRRAAFESINGFDESFFMYFEEADLCYRLRRAGWQIHFTPTATVVHSGGASTTHNRSAMARELHASLRRFYAHHYSPHQLAQLRLVSTYALLRKILRAVIALRYVQQPKARARMLDELNICKGVLAAYWQ